MESHGAAASPGGYRNKRGSCSFGVSSAGPHGAQECSIHALQSPGIQDGRFGEANAGRGFQLATRGPRIHWEKLWSLQIQMVGDQWGRYCENFEAFGYRSKNPVKSYKIVSLGAECWGSHSASFTFLCVFARCYRQEKNSQQFYRKHYSLILLPRVFTVWNFTFCYCDVFLSLFFLYPFLP